MTQDLPPSAFTVVGPDDEWLSVEQVATRLGIKSATVAKMIREGRLAGRKIEPDREKSPWRVARRELDRYLTSMQAQAQRDRVRDRLRAANVIVGYGDDFDEGMAASDNSPAVKERVKALVRKHEIFERLQREMFLDSDLRARLDALDEESRIEAEARELAKHYRRDERIRRRALEILDDDEDADQGRPAAGTRPCGRSRF